jgi:formate hydrogenlyase transcriptional activator
MSAAPSLGVPLLDEGLRHSLVLRAWEAITPERELNEILRVTADILLPYVQMDSLGIVVFAIPAPRPYAFHVVGWEPKPGETLHSHLRETMQQGAPFVPQKPLLPYPTKEESRRAGADFYHCPDLFAKEAWYEHEFRMAAAGCRSYCTILLPLRGENIGCAVCCRALPVPFSDEEIGVLREVAQAFRVAVANALANEEISRLKDQLAAENLSLKEKLGSMPWFGEIVGDSSAMRQILETVEQVAGTDATVFISGETGTGKELIARALHRRSPRAAGPMIKVNCAAIPPTLLASELFGHERGAFTGATERRRGRFEQANRGTIFLDEIGELSAEMQVLLLRVLQEREFERLGGGETVHTNARVIAASNRDLEEDVRQGRFRSDLFYRLNVIPVRMPALRERPEDIPALTQHFVEKYAARCGRVVERIERRSLRLLETYPWPGNVRELENVIERAVVLSHGGTLRVDRSALPGAAEIELNTDLQQEQRGRIEATLRATGGRISGVKGAAKRLGLAPATLEYRLRRLGIDKLRFRAR